MEEQLNLILTNAQVSKQQSRSKIISNLKRNEDISKQLTQQCMETLNHQVKHAHSNQAEIDKLIQDNKTQVQKLVKNNQKWVQTYDQLLKQLKEAGDLVNWAQVMEIELANVNAAIAFRSNKN